MTALAKRLLVGSPATSQEALPLLDSAAALGDPDAFLLQATLAAAGAWRPQSWDEALDLLALAAERGSASGREQLRLLAGDAADGDDFPSLRNRVEIAPWLQAPPRTPVCDSPRIRVAERFVSKDVCAWLIGRAKDKLAAAKIFAGSDGAAAVSASRSNSAFFIDIVQSDVVICLLRARISAFVALPTACFESPQVLHYAVGQEFRPHFDFLRRESAGSEAARSERIMTVLVYLNADYEGGETDFPRAGFRWKGGPGDAMAFANVDPAGVPDPLTLHAGLPPRRGEKWLFSQWIRDRATFGGPIQ